MATPSARSDLDRRIAALAAEQYGVVSHAQLGELGLDRSAIRRRYQAGRLHRIYRNAFAVGHVSLSERGRWMAAVLAGGRGALLSHWSLARLHGLRVTDNGPHISAPRRNLSTIRGVVVHRPRSLTDEDRDFVDRIPATSIFRMLLDIAPGLSQDRLVNAIDYLDRRLHPDWNRARLLLMRMTGHRGVKPLRTALDASVLFPELTRSELERDLLRVCDEAKVKRPAMNYVIAGYEVDAHWPGTNVVIELDSYDYHGTVTAFRSDRDRDINLQLLGFQVHRFGPWRFGPNRPQTIELVRRLAPR